MHIHLLCKVPSDVLQLSLVMKKLNIYSANFATLFFILNEESWSILYSFTMMKIYLLLLFSSLSQCLLLSHCVTASTTTFYQRFVKAQVLAQSPLFCSHAHSF